MIDKVSGQTFVYGGIGDDTITKLPYVDGNTLNIDGGYGNNTVNVSYAGSGNYLINVTDTSAAPTPVNLTSDGTGSAHELCAVTPDATFDPNTAVSPTDSTITIGTSVLPGNSYFTGEMVRYQNGGSYLGDVGGLDNGQVYYVIVKDAATNTIQLALTMEDALKPTPVPIALTPCSGTGMTNSLVAPSVTRTFDPSTTVSGDTITYDSHGYLNGEAVRYENGGNGATDIGGLTSGNVYYVIVVDTNTIKLSATPLTIANTLNIYGTDQSDTMLLRASADPSGKAFVAVLHNTDVERVNYDAATNDLIVRTGGGNDSVTLDDNRTKTVIYGGDGTNTFQVGQIFQSPRDVASAQVAPDDVFETTLTTRGYLSNGVSYDATIVGGNGNDSYTVYRNRAILDLVGGSGNDTFTIRAFATESVLSRVNAGSSQNTINYVANANLEIDGGGGVNTLRLIATEFDDTFIVTDTGIYGAGRTISFEDIQTLIIDGAEGNDTFYILSTPAIAHVEIYGGLGSDRFVIDGDVPGNANVDAGARDAHGNVTYYNNNNAVAGSHNLSSIKGDLTIDGGPTPQDAIAAPADAAR